MDSTWFQLLQYNQHAQRRLYALTIPFIIGGLRTPIGDRTVTPQDCHLELTALLKNMLDATPEGFVTRLSRCDRLHQPVVAPFEARYKVHGEPLQSGIQSRPTLFVDREFFSRGSICITTLTERLWQELATPICEGRFSFQNESGVYSYFDHEDLAFLETGKHYELDNDA